METPAPGKMLISDPFLKDPNFARSVILLCDHQQDGGSLGFIINKLSGYTLDELLPDDTGIRFPIYLGGPVQLNTLHFIHKSPHLLQEGTEIVQGLYMGGDFDQAMELVNTGRLNADQIKFFVGYSGWGSGQLENEMKDHSWIISDADADLVFREAEDTIWPLSLKNLGAEFARMANYPIDPSLN